MIRCHVYRLPYEPMRADGYALLRSPLLPRDTDRPDVADASSSRLRVRQVAPVLGFEPRSSHQTGGRSTVPSYPGKACVSFALLASSSPQSIAPNAGKIRSRTMCLWQNSGYGS